MRFTFPIKWQLCLLWCCGMWLSCSPQLKQYALRPSDIIRPETVTLPTSGSAINNPCLNPNNYAPDSNYINHTPVRYLRINLHFLNSSDSSRNFDEKLGREFAHTLVNACNHWLQNNQKMFLPHHNTTAVLPTQVQYVITPCDTIPNDDGIYFHYNDTLSNFNKRNHGSIKRADDIYSMRQFDNYAISPDKVLNIFLMEHPRDSIVSPTYKASSDGVGLYNWVKVVACYQFYQQKLFPTWGDVAWFATGIMNHEIGHSLGLMHTWSGGDGCDDTPNNPNCWNVAPGICDSLLSNNVMDYNAWRNAYTPCQIGKMQYNFCIEGSSQRSRAVPKWCEYQPNAPIIIPRGKTLVWNCGKDVESDIILQDHAQLIINCPLSMPKGSRIIVATTAQLIVNNTVINNRCGDSWNGVVIERMGKQRGKVALIGNAKLENIIGFESDIPN